MDSEIDWTARTTFARTPNETLQLWSDLVTFHKRGFARYDADPLGLQRALGPQWHEASMMGGLAANDRRDFWTAVREVPLYWWSGRTASLITEAARSYPLEPEEAANVDTLRSAEAAGRAIKPPGYLPRIDHALAAFEEPTVTVDIDGRAQPLSALLWQVSVSARHRQLWLLLRGLLWDPGGQRAATVWFSQGGTAGRPAMSGDASGTFAAERLALTKWVCAASMFLEQELLGTERVAVQRAFAKRAMKVGRQDVPSVHVVTLRQVVRSAAPAGEGERVDWAWRWLVRGHWRRQWFPSRAAHAPVWIQPHVKGPDDKPMKPAAPTVFAVKR